MKKTLLPQILAAAVLLALSAAVLAQTGAGDGPAASGDAAQSASAPLRGGKKMDQDLKDAEILLRKTEAILGRRPAAPRGAAESACQKILDGAPAPSSPAAAAVAPSLYPACVALAQRSPESCSELLGGDGAPAKTVADCLELQNTYRFMYAIGSDSAETRSDCVDALAAMHTAYSGHFAAGSRAELCAALAGAKSAGEAAAASRKLAATPFAANDPALDFDLLFAPPSFQCASASDSICRDALAILRAARARDSKSCGDSVLCRAAFRKGQACAPLLTSFCGDALTARGVESQKKAALYTEVRQAVAAVLSESDQLEPRSDPANQARVSRARSLARRLDAINSKWNPKRRPKPAH